MLLLNWLSGLKSSRALSRLRRSSRRRTRRRRDRALRFSPWSEVLEERLMLTVQTHFDELTGTNGPVFGNVDPESIDIELMPQEQSTHTVTLAFAPPTPQRTVDVVFVVDESGSMEGEQAWLTEMVTDLNDALVADGITDNRFALVGYLDQGRIFGTESGTAPADLLVSFYAPDNTLVQSATVPVTSQSGLIKADFTLPQSGEYTVVVQNKSSSATYSYSFVVGDATPAYAGPTLSLGEMTRGRIIATTDTHDYTFTLGSASTLYFEALSATADLEWTLTGPGGNVVTDRDLSAGNLQVAAASGSYTLTVSSPGTSVGPYAFRLLDLGAASSVTSGTTVNGTLNPATQSDSYALSVTSGDRLYFNSLSTSLPAGIRWRLVDDSGATVFEQSLKEDHDLVTAASTGTYHLIIDGDPSDASSSRSYSFVVQNLGAEPSATSLTLGSAVSSSIGTAGERDKYTFTLSSAALLAFDSQTNSATIQWSLTGPSGTVIDNLALNAGDPILQLASGTYTLTIDGVGDATGSYSFNLLDSAVAATSLTPDTPVTANLNPANSTKVYQFSASTGDKYIFDSQAWNGSSSARWVLADPFGHVIFNAPLNQDVSSTTLTAAGTYTLYIVGDPADTTSNPEFTINVDPDGTDSSNPPTLTLGQPVGGTISASLEQDEYQFTLGSTTIVAFDALVGTSNFRWTLDDGTNTIVSNRALTASDGSDVSDGNAVLSLASGTYTLTIDAETGITGEYGFRLIGLAAAATALTTGNATSGQLRTGKKTDVYSFSAISGERVHFDSLSWSGSADAHWRIVNASGTVLAGDTLADSAGYVSISSTGTYYVLVEGDFGETAAVRPYSFQIDKETISATTAYTLGNTASASISAAGEKDEFTFSGTAGETIHFDWLSAATTNHSVQLRAPDGTLALSSTYSSATNPPQTVAPLALTQTGTYHLVVGANSSSTGSYSFQILNVDAQPEQEVGDDFAGSFSAAREDDAYTFAGQAGQRVTIEIDAWQTAAQLSTSAQHLTHSGGTEDGYNAIDEALQHLTFRDGASKHVILITDEDRDISNSNLTYSSMQTALDNLDIILHSILEMTIDTTTQSTDALGITGDATDSTAFFPNGSGGFTSAASGGVTFTAADSNNPGTKTAYIDLTFDLGGTVWDLQDLRAGGLLAESFSAAFVSTIADEIEASFLTTLVATDPTVEFEILSETLTATDVSYDIRFTGDGDNHVFDLKFVTEEDPNFTMGLIPVTIRAYYVQLLEETDFNSAYEIDFTVPQNPAALSIKFSDLYFDTTDTDAINDAFELALVDANGNPLVGMIQAGHDAVFNVTEGESPALGNGVLYNSTTHTVTVDISHLAAGTEATLIARLVNNDADTDTRVAIYPTITTLTTSPVEDPSTMTPGITARPHQTIDWAHLSDVTASVTFDYDRTSFNEKTDTLIAQMAVENSGQFAIRGPVLVVVKNISEPLVRAVSFDGVTPEGNPYYDVTSLITGGQLDASELSSDFGLSFYNPDQVQFTYDLEVLGHLNLAPEITTTPELEIVAGLTYSYDSGATDPENDTLTYSLVSGPNGLTIDDETGELSWTTTSGSVGQHPIVIRVTDPFGATDEQAYTLNVISNTVPNRPPIFTSIPIVDTYLGITYAYDSNATDADGDTLEYSLVSGPTGMAVDSETGLITWNPTADLVDTLVPVTIKVEDGHGGEAEQQYLIYVHPELGNHPPIIVSEPNLTFVLPDLNVNPSFGSVDPDRIDIGLLPGENNTQTVTLDLPSDAFATDIVIVVDVSSSMTIELPWIDNLTQALNDALEARGIFNNRFSLIGYMGDARIYAASPEPFKVSLYGPDNELVRSVYIPDTNSDTIYLDDLELPEDGEYVVVVSRDRGETIESEEYRFVVEQVPEIVQTQALALGNMVQGTIQGFGERHEYTFTLADTTRLYFDTLVTNLRSDVHWSLTGPDGEIVTERLFQLGDRIFTAPAGSYTLTIDAPGTELGDYKFRLLNLTAGDTALTPGTEVNGTLSPSTSTDIYSFTASSGNRFYFDSVSWSGPSAARWRLLDKFGNTLFDNQLEDDEPTLTLSAGGEYILLVEGAVADTEASRSYTINVVPEDVSTAALTLGNVVSTSLATPGARKEYTFTLSGNTFLLFDSLTDSDDLQWSLVGPEGEIISATAFSAGDQVLRLHAGDFTLVVSGSGDATGNFSFRLVNPLTAATAITPDTPETDTLSPGNETHIYSLDAELGDQFSFDSQAWNGSSAAQWQLLDPYGTVIFSKGLGQDQATVTLAADGTYTLLVQGDVAETVTDPEYTIEVVSEGSDPPTAFSGSAITLGSVVDGTISTAYEVDKYQFTLSTDALLYFDVLSDHDEQDNELGWTLRGPAGVVIDAHGLESADSNNVDDSEVVLHLPAGDYEVSILGGSATESYSFRMSDLMDGASLTPGTTVNGTLTPGRETDIYNFIASAGDRIYFDSLSSGPRVRLIDPFGTVLFSGLIANDVDTITLSSAGEYALIVEGAPHSSSSSVAYSFNVRPETVTTTDLVDLAAIREVSSTIGGLAERDVYTFTLADDAWVWFDSLTNNASFLWSLEGSWDSGSNWTELVAPRGFDLGDRLLKLSAGDYRITVDAPGTVTGSYAFRLLDLLTHGISLTPDTPVSATLEPGNETTVYQFSADAGERFAFDKQTWAGPLESQWQLYSPSGERLFGQTMGSDAAMMPLPETGDYTLVIAGAITDTASTRTFVFNVDPEDLTPPPTEPTVYDHTLSLNTTTSEEIEVAGDSHVYHLSLDDQALLYFDTLTNSSTLTWKLEGPQGELVAARGFNAADLVAGLLPAAEYTLTVEGTSGATGAFSFRLLDLVTFASTFTLGTAKSGTLDPAKRTDVYKFTAEADDIFDFTAPTQSMPSGAKWKLIAPSGTQVFSSAIGTNQNDVTLTETGTYYILLEGDVTDINSTRAYTFTATKESYPLLGTTISFNTIYSGTISTFGEDDYYNFTLTSPKLIYFDRLSRHGSTDEFEWSLEGEDGAITLSGDFSGGNILLLPAGGYNILVTNEQDEDPYKFRVLDLATFATSITLDANKSGTLSEASPNNHNGRETDVYKFTAAAGDIFKMEWISGTPNTNSRWRLIAPDGTAVFDQTMPNEGSAFTVDLAGEYYLLLEGHVNDNSTTRTYTVYVDYQGNDPPDPPAPTALTLNQTYSGAISVASEVDEYSFTLGATTKVYFDSLTNSSTLRWSLDDGTNTIVSNRALDASDAVGVSDSNVVLDLAAGTYTLSIDASSGTGAYAFRLLNLATAGGALTPGTAVTSTVASAAETDVYRFTISAASRLFFDALAWNGSTDARWRLIDPSGTILANNSLETDTSYLSLASTGTYTLLIEGAVADTALARLYKFLVDVEQISSTGSLTLGNVTSGTISAAGELDEFTFTGTTGQRLIFDWLSAASANMHFKLRDPNGVVILEANYDNPEVRNQLLAVTLAENGTYHLILSGNSGATGAYSYRLLDVAAQEELEFDVTTAGEFDSATVERDLYRFDGTAGSRLVLRFDPWGTADEALVSTGDLAVDNSGFQEDGYAGIASVLENLPFREFATRQMILVTDEQRTVVDTTVTYPDLRDSFRNLDVTLHSVVNLLPAGANINSDIFGVDGEGSEDTAYYFDAEATEGYNSGTSGGITYEFNYPFGTPAWNITTKQDYVDLAFDLGGTVWNSDYLRNGVDHDTFFAAFGNYVAGKIDEDLEITLLPTDPGVPFEILDSTLTASDISFDVRFTGDGNAYGFDLQFVRAENSGIVLGSIPTTIRTDYFYDVDAVDPDDDPLVYEMVGETYGATFDAETGLMRWLPPEAGEYEFTVQVSDGRGGIDTQTWTVTVTVTGEGNSAPEFDAVDPPHAAVDREYELDLSATDADDNQLLYQLIDDPTNGYPIPDGMTIDPLTGVISWTPTEEQEGTHDVKVRVHDGLGGSDTEILTIVVDPLPVFYENQNPVIVSSAPNLGQAGNTYRYDVNAIDPDGDPVEYDLALGWPGMVIDSRTGVIVWRTERDLWPVPAYWPVVVRVRDDQGGVTLHSWQILMSPPNETPRFDPIPTLVAEINEEFNYQTAPFDPELGGLVLTLVSGPAGLSFDPQTAIVNWTPTSVGVYHVVLAATDPVGLTGYASFDLAVVDPLINGDPEILSTPRDTITLGRTMLHEFGASDPDGDPLTFSLVSGPTGMTVSSAGLLSWAPTAAQITAPGTPHQYTVRVEDGRGGWDEALFEINVVVDRVNSAPDITTTPKFAATVNSQYVYDLDATDPDNDLLVWTLEQGAPGMVIDSRTGVVTWTPTAFQVGEHSIRVRVSDPYGGFDTQTYTLTVRGTNLPPMITSAPPTTGRDGDAYSYQVEANDPDGDALTYSLVGYPTGMTIDSQTGLIEWTPDGSGTANVTVQVTDARGATARQAYSIEVDAVAVNQPPYITSMPTFQVRIGDTYTYDVDATDPNNDTLTYSLDSTSLGLGMTINSSIGLLEWTPTSGQVGQHFVTVSVTDGTYTATQRFALYAFDNTAPFIAPFDDYYMPAGRLFRANVGAYDPDNEPITYTLTDGPTGMTIDQFGRLSWQTTAGDVGTHNVEVTVTDPWGSSALTSFDVIVDPDTTDPTVTILTSASPAPLDSTVTITVRAYDAVALASVVLTVDGVVIPLAQDGTARILIDSLTSREIEATVNDASGNETIETITLTVYNPTDTQAPLVAIATPTYNTTVTAPIDVTGTVDDPDDNLASWTLTVTPYGEPGASPRTIATGTTEVTTTGTLGTLDPTTLANGTYTLTLTAVDAGSHSASTSTLVTIDGNLKLGNFALSFVDMQIPVAGFPITVTRSYNTLDAQKPGDFGYGWKLDIANTKVEVWQPDGTQLSDFSDYIPFRDGTRVIITLPDGTKEGFTFYGRPADYFPVPWNPIWVPGQPFEAMIIFSYAPYFHPDAGVTSQLIVDNVPLQKIDDEYVALGTVDAYDPARPGFGGTYTLNLANRNSLLINANTGELQSVTDRAGNTLTFTDMGIVSSAGRAVEFERDYDNRITALIDPAGNRITYSYDSSGNLVAVTDRTGNTTEFTYLSDPAHYLDEIIDPLGRTAAQTEYDSAGRVSVLHDADGNATEFEYSAGEVKTQTITDPLGGVTVQTFDDRGNIIREVNAVGGIITRTFDERDRLLSQTLVIGQEDSPQNGETNDLTTSTTYDVHGNVLSQTDVAGNTAYRSYDITNGQLGVETDPLGNSTYYYYHPLGELTSIMDPLGNLTRLSYPPGTTEFRIHDIVDPQGNRSGFDYNSFGDITVVYSSQRFAELPYVQGSPGIYVHYDPYATHKILTYTTFEYDELGRQTTTTSHWTNPDDPEDVREHTRTTEYDAEGRTTRIEYALGQEELTTYTATGQIATTTDQLGHETSYLYDARGRLIETTFWNGQVSRTVYDAKGRAIYSDDPHLPSETPQGTHTIYDAADRVVGTEQLATLVIDLVQTAGIWSAVLTSAGTVLTSYSSEYDNAGRLLSSTDTYGLETRYLYDQFGRTVETRHQAIDENDQTVWIVSRTVFDQFGRTVLSTDSYIEGSSDPIFGNRTEYDSFGRVVKSFRLQGVDVDIVDAVTSAPVDPLTDPDATVLSLIADNGTILYSTETIYDQYGHVSRTISGATSSPSPLAGEGWGEGLGWGEMAQITDYEYDTLGRQTAVISHAIPAEEAGLTATAGTLVRLRTETVYDSLGQVSQTRTNIRQFIAPNGTVTIDDSAVQVTTYKYDEYGRVVKTIFNDDSFTETEYDDFGRVISETNQVGQTRTFEYDVDGRLVAVVLPEVTNPATSQPEAPRYEYEYDTLGNQTVIRDPLGRETRFTYDEQGRQLTRTLPLGFGPDGILGTSDDSTLPEGDFTEQVVYDARGRMSLAVSFEGVVTQYVYSEETGRLSEQRFFTNLAAYDDGNGTPSDVWSFTLDAFGRQVEVERTGGTGSASVLTSYDPQGRVTRIESPQGIISYAYDVLGRRTKTMIGEASNPSSEEQYRYDVLGRLIGVDVVKRNGVTIDNDSGTAGDQPETTSYQYDLVGNLDRTDLPNGVVTDYVYDAMNRLDVLTHYAPDSDPENLANNDKLAEFDYEVREDGRRTGVVEKFWVDEGSGPVEVTNTITWEYDDLNRLIDEVFVTDADTLLSAPSLPAGTRAWTDYTDHYEYDLTGNRLEKTTDLGNDSSIDETITYDYDANDRLLQEVDDLTSGTDTTTNYEYDRTQQTVKEVYEGTPGNLGDIQSSQEFSYDLQGRLEVATVTTYTSGVASRIERTTYDYDASGIRVSALTETDADADQTFESSTRTEYLIDARNFTGYQQAIQETVYDDSSTPQVVKVTSFDFGLGLISQTVIPYSGGSPQTPSTIWLLMDGHGSTRLAADATGSIAQSSGVNQVYHYDAYGNAIGFAAALALTTHLYNSEQFIALTGLYNFRGRDYRPESGTFPSLDPFRGNLRDPQSLHKYLFVHGDPINGTDPTGRSLISVTATIGIMAGLGAGFAVLANGLRNKAEGHSFWSGSWEAARNGAILGPIIGLFPVVGIAFAFV